jgi:hypothetical protein
MNDKISASFGLESSKEIVKDIRKETRIAKKVKVENESDYEFARGNLKELIYKGSEALDDLLELAKVMENPNVYVVLAQLLKTIGDQNISLIDIQEKVKAKTEKSQQGTNIEQAVFIGTTSDLQRALKELK